MRWLPLALLALMAVACGDGGELLLVELKTDYVAGIEVATAATVIRTEDGTERARREAPISPVSDLTSGVRIADVAGLAVGRYEVEVTLFDVRGETTATRAVRVEVAGSTGVTVVITRSCEGVVCPDVGDPTATACLGGRCVPPECTPETPEACPAPVCPETPCPTGAACADALCEEGECFLVARTGSCGAGEWCEPQAGCMPLPAGIDGGPDAMVPTDATPPGDATVDGGADADAGPPVSPTVECTGETAVFPTTLSLVEPSLRIDGVTLFARQRGETYVSTRSSPTASDFSMWTLTTAPWARSDAAFIDEGAGEVSVAAAGRAPRNLEWCEAPLDLAPCNDIMVFDDRGVVIDADQDGPTLALIDGELVMAFSQGVSLYFARPLTGERLTWEARPIDVGTMPVDDPALTPDGSLLVIPEEGSENLWVMDYDPAADNYDNLRRVVGARGGSPEIGTATSAGFELFVSFTPVETSQPYRWQCVLR